MDGGLMQLNRDLTVPSHKQVSSICQPVCVKCHMLSQNQSECHRSAAHSDRWSPISSDVFLLFNVMREQLTGPGWRRTEPGTTSEMSSEQQLQFSCPPASGSSDRCTTAAQFSQELCLNCPPSFFDWSDWCAQFMVDQRLRCWDT